MNTHGFTGATVAKAANIYFDGKVTSRTVVLADGLKKTGPAVFEVPANTQ